jgi:hypothetical protein
VLVNLPANITSLSNIVTIINSYYIDGIEASLNGNYNIQIQNNYGTPFLLYDGLNTPLANLGILPVGTIYANVSNVMTAGWWTSELTQFDANTTVFTDMGSFIDISDEFLQDDDGSIYIKFPTDSF